MTPLAHKDITEIINTAIAHEEKNGVLRLYLERELPLLQRKLILPEPSPVDALMTFITSYIKSVPSSLALVSAVSRHHGFFNYAAPFLHLAEDYFLQPPSAIPNSLGLDALLDEAFLAHRLLEEINDHHMKHLQRPLLPIDMTEANIIVHHLLGDTFATRLEELVQFTASQLLGREHVWNTVKSSLGNSDYQPLTSDTIEGWGRDIRLKLAS